MLVGIVHVNSRRRAFRASLVPGSGVIAEGMKRVAVWNSFFLQPRECFIKVLARQRKRQMLIALRAPRRELDSEVFTNSDYREWPILALQFEAQNVDIEINAGSNLVDVKNYVIDRGHVVRSPGG